MRIIFIALLIGAMAVSFIKEPAEEKRIVEAHYSEESEMESSTIQKNNIQEIDLLQVYPVEVVEREEYIRGYLAENYTVEELSNEEIENLIKIAKKESSAHDPLIEPKSTVWHCKSDKWFAVENTIGCPEGSVSGRYEKSIGVFQILPSTYKGYGCEGDIREVNNQIDCAVKIYKRAGYNAWYNSAVKVGLI